jgi:hypothetical protein
VLSIGGGRGREKWEVREAKEVEEAEEASPERGAEGSVARGGFKT